MSQESFNTFYSTVCHVCKAPGNARSSSESLKTCQGCKLILYCSVDHQKKHWSEHRKFCKAIQRLMTTLNVKHVFENVATTISTKEWCDFRTKIKLLCEVILKQPLSACESEMLYFPSVCLFCCKIFSGTMILCKDCQCVSYCSSKHLEEDAKYHSKSCKKLRLCFDLDLAAFHGSLPVVNLEFVERHPCHSAENFSAQFMDFALISNRLSDEQAVAVYFTILSCPLTFIYTVYKTRLHLSKELTVHLIGAGSFEIQHLLMWDIVFHWLPNLTQLHLILIGPEVYTTSEFAICTNCEQAGCKFTAEFCPGQLYHNYVTSSEFTTPDLIAMYNCGLSEFVGGEQDTWQNSIPFIMASNCPVLMTSYTAREAEHDLSRLMTFDEKIKVLTECEENIFSARKPMRDWEQFGPYSDSLVFYHNAFLSVLVPKTFSCL